MIRLFCLESIPFRFETFYAMTESIWQTCSNGHIRANAELFLCLPHRGSVDDCILICKWWSVAKWSSLDPFHWQIHCLSDETVKFSAKAAYRERFVTHVLMLLRLISISRQWNLNFWKVLTKTIKNYNFINELLARSTSCRLEPIELLIRHFANWNSCN